MEQAKRVDRASRSRDAPGDSHRSARGWTASVGPARAQWAVESGFADARGRITRAEARRLTARTPWRLIKSTRQAACARATCSIGDAQAQGRRARSRAASAGAFV